MSLSCWCNPAKRLPAARTAVLWPGVTVDVIIWFETSRVAGRPVLLPFPRGRGEVFGGSAQHPADPVERVIAAAAVPAGLLLDAEHPDRLGQRRAERGGVTTERVERGDRDTGPPLLGLARNPVVEGLRAERDRPPAACRARRPRSSPSPRRRRTPGRPARPSARPHRRGGTPRPRPAPSSRPVDGSAPRFSSRSAPRMPAPHSATLA